MSITQSDCYIPTEWQDSSMKENMVIAMFEINVYSNKAEGKKTECKKIIKDMPYLFVKSSVALNFT